MRWWCWHVGLLLTLPVILSISWTLKQPSVRNKPQSPEQWLPSIPLPPNYSPFQIVRQNDATSVDKDHVKQSLLLGVLTGGRDFEKKVLAQVSTFVDNDTWFVTRRHIPAPRTIFSDQQVENGGKPKLYLKTLRFFHNVTHTPAFEKYDWVMKADDDTYVNLPRLRTLLSNLDPNVPIYLGSSRYTLTKTKNAPKLPHAETGKYFRDVKAPHMCHGGSGYVLSRGLLRLLRDRFKFCEQSSPRTSMEDAKIAFCVLQFAGLECTPMQERPGGFDALRNTRAGAKSLAQTNELISKDPVLFYMGTTFHRVDPKTMNLIHHHRNSMKSNISLNRIANARTSKWWNSHISRFIVTWNCTVVQSVAGKEDHNVYSRNAICQQRAIITNGRSVAKSISINNQQSSYINLMPPRPSMRSSNRLIAVFAESDCCTLHPNAFAQLLDSLRESSVPKAEVVLFTSDHLIWKDLQANGSLEGITSIVTLPKELKTDPRPILIRKYAALAGYLLDNLHRYSQSLHCPIDTIFEIDPFSSLPSRGGVSLFMSRSRDDRNTMREPDLYSTSTPVENFGICSAMEIRQPREWLGPLPLDPSVILGTPQAHAEALLATIAHLDAAVADGLEKQCSPRNALSRAIWDGTVARRTNVTIFTPENTFLFPGHPYRFRT